MFRDKTRFLIGLLLTWLVLSCTPESVKDDSVELNNNPSITGDSSIGSPDQEITEPPPATLTIDDRK